MHAVVVVKVLVAQSYLTTWTVAHQASLSIGFSRQEYWSGEPRACKIATVLI